MDDATTKEPKKKGHPRRQELKDLSKGLQVQVKDGVIESVNEGLKELYANQGHEELNTFNRWRQLGFKVNKGSKALLLWGSPVKKEVEADAEDGMSFFPLCNVFSNQQVSEI